MDPQSLSFTPLGSQQADAVHFQQVLTEHNERIARLERQNNDDARMKSLWGPNSAFPSILGGTPQQATPQHYTSSDNFRSYDEDPNNMMSSLHLDADDEPRSRAMGATSRANSVRFDETANQNHFSSHSSRPSLDLTSRQSSGYSGGLHMSERTPSHKSEPRASSAHSLRSAASGRASSLNLDYGTGESSSPLDTPGFAPGLLLLGPTPAIIRCWLDRNFNQGSLYYAAVCTGSCRSWIDLRLIHKLGIQQAIHSHDEGPRTMSLRLYFSEGVPTPSIPSRSRSPFTTHLPSLEIEFCVLEGALSAGESKSIQVIIGSDVLQPYQADILFSTNKMTIHDNEGKKLTIPLVRPEDEAVYINLAISGAVPMATPTDNSSRNIPEADEPAKQHAFLNGLGKAGSTISSPSAPSATTTAPTSIYRPPGALATESASSEPAKLGAASSDAEARPLSRQSTTSKPALSQLNTRHDEVPALPISQPAPAPTPAGNPPGLWSSWRREGAPSSTTPAAAAAVASGTPDWASTSKARDSFYTRKDTGIKVLRPKTANRTFSGTVTTPTTTNATTASPASDSKSRFFGGGRLYTAEDENNTTKPSSKDVPTVSASKPKKVNPIGSGSAFQWLGK